MIYSQINGMEGYYELVADNGDKMLIPSTNIIIVNDGSGLLSIKNTASRCTVALVRDNN